MQSLSSQEREALSKERKDQGFQKFLNEPLVRMALSTTLQGEHQEGLQMILRAAFDSGVNCGAGDVAYDLLNSLFKDKKKE